MKKYFLFLVVIGLVACLLVGCNVTTPAEGEGEGEGEGEEVARVVLVELYNTDGEIDQERCIANIKTTISES